MATNNSVEANEPNVNIEGTSYKLSELPEAARKQYYNITTTDEEIKRQQSRLAMLQTARNAYARALIEAVRDSEKSGS